MKTTLQTLSIAIVLVISAFAANASKVYSGYVVTMANDTLFGQVHVSTPTVNELKVKFTNDKGETKTYNPSDLSAYAFQVPTYSPEGVKSMLWITFVKKQVEEAPIRIASTDVFVEIRVAGAITLYDYYVERNSDKIGQEVEHVYYIEKEGKLTFQSMTQKNYKEILKDLTSNMPELSEKIGTTGYGYKHIVSIVTAYNEKNPVECKDCNLPLLTSTSAE